MNKPIKAIVPSNLRGEGTALYGKSMRLPVVEALGGGLFITRKPSKLARLSVETMREHGLAGIVARHAFALHTVHGIAVIGSDSLEALRDFAVALASSSHWASVEAAPDALAQHAAWGETPKAEREALGTYASACQGAM